MSNRKIKTFAPKGTRDFLPVQMFTRNKIINLIKKIFEKYGYEPLETPSIERLDVLTGKYGEEGDQLIFKILKRGTGLDKVGVELKEFTVTDYKDIIDLGLKYDLTVPLCRVIAMHKDKITFPFKRYQIQPVWRADKPQKGRYREFYQCDVDVAGSSSMLADFEIIYMVYEILKTLGFKNFLIRINNRKILNAILEHCKIEQNKSFFVLSAIDKLDKIGKKGVINELKKKNINEKVIDNLLEIILLEGTFEQKLNELGHIFKENKIGNEGIEELKEIFYYLSKTDIDSDFYSLDLSLSRGLEYYTGPIYESVVKEPKIGSLTGGGRYDKLIGMFLGEDVPATGTSLGIERIIDVMTELNMIPETKTITKVLITTFDENLKQESINTTWKIRNSGINAELFFEPLRLNKQLSYANKKGIPFVCIIGPDEKKQNKVKVKNMKTGEEKLIENNKIVEFIKSITD
ncbi:histidine--tRNA ligase [candidate division KSB1 bacterium]|nr:MAG: histidine--tRNA ligase [candidate division KSB1 bacterium]